MVVYTLQTHWKMCQKLRSGAQSEAINYFKIIQTHTRPTKIIMKAIRVAMRGLN